MKQQKAKGIFGFGIIDGQLLNAVSPPKTTTKTTLAQKGTLTKAITDRPTYGVFVANADELRTLRRTVVGQVFMAAYLGAAISRLPKLPLA